MEPRAADVPVVCEAGIHHISGPSNFGSTFNQWAVTARNAVGESPIFVVGFVHWQRWTAAKIHMRYSAAGPRPTHFNLYRRQSTNRMAVSGLPWRFLATVEAGLVDTVYVDRGDPAPGDPCLNGVPAACPPLKEVKLAPVGVPIPDRVEPVAWFRQCVRPETRRVLKDLLTKDDILLDETYGDLSGREPRVATRSCSRLDLGTRCQFPGILEDKAWDRARARLADAAEYLVASGALRGQRHVLRYNHTWDRLEWSVFVLPERCKQLRAALRSLVLGGCWADPDPAPEAPEWPDEEL